MKLQIKEFVFKRPQDGIRLPFETPDEAITYFNKKGYGMHNWEILVIFNDMYETHTVISLIMFNYITDHWNIITKEG